jgi:hypothetical protein
MTTEPETRRTRDMIVENHSDFREIMKVLLESQPDIDLMAQPWSPICAGMATR